MARIEVDVDGDIHGQRRPREWDAAIAALAERQHGVASRAQLLALGLSAEAIDHRVRLGRLHLLHRGVYAVGHRAVTREGRWLTAVLAGGARAALSHRSAAVLWGLLASFDGPAEVIAPKERRSREGVRFRRIVLPADETTARAGIPVTTVPRTLLDLAAVLPARRLERAVNEAEVERLTDPLTLDDLLTRHPRCRGIRTLRALGSDPSITRSGLERDFLSFIAKYDLPRPHTNLQIDGIEVDCVWPDQRVIAELDGRAVHTTHRAFERDRERDRRLTAAGWRVVRITWRQLHDEPAALEADLRRLLG